MQQGLVLVVSLWAVLFIGGAHAQYVCMRKTSGKLCTLVKSTDVATTLDATAVDPSYCVTLFARSTFQFCNRLTTEEADGCFRANCNKPCRRFTIKDCKCDVIIGGPFINDCIARNALLWIALYQGISPDQITSEVIDNKFCENQNRGALVKHTCTGPSDEYCA